VHIARGSEDLLGWDAPLTAIAAIYMIFHATGVEHDAGSTPVRGFAESKSAG
jgi:hypothetical protein